jgi:hypothetical protein
MPIFLKINNIEVEEKICPECKKPFLPIDLREEYCSLRCKKVVEEKKRKFRMHSKKFTPREEQYLEEKGKMTSGDDPLFSDWLE